MAWLLLPDYLSAPLPFLHFIFYVVTEWSQCDLVWSPAYDPPVGSLCNQNKISYQSLNYMIMSLPSSPPAWPPTPSHSLHSSLSDLTVLWAGQTASHLRAFLFPLSLMLFSPVFHMPDCLMPFHHFNSNVIPLRHLSDYSSCNRLFD